MELPAENKRYTFADVLTWDESERIEIINGEAFMMAPPSRVHQEISVAIAAQLYNCLEGKRCKVYPTYLWSAILTSWTITAARVLQT